MTTLTKNLSLQTLLAIADMNNDREYATPISTDMDMQSIKCFEYIFELENTEEAYDTCRELLEDGYACRVIELNNACVVEVFDEIDSADFSPVPTDEYTEHLIEAIYG